MVSMRALTLLEVVSKPGDYGRWFSHLSGSTVEPPSWTRSRAWYADRKEIFETAPTCSLTTFGTSGQVIAGPPDAGRKPARKRLAVGNDFLCPLLLPDTELDFGDGIVEVIR